MIQLNRSWYDQDSDEYTDYIFFGTLTRFPNSKNRTVSNLRLVEFDNKILLSK